MNLDDLIKYLIWIVFFIIAATGVYFLLGKIGITGDFIKEINLNQEQQLYRGVIYQIDNSKIRVLNIYDDKIKIMINNNIKIIYKNSSEIFQGFKIEIIKLNKKGRDYAILKINILGDENDICQKVWYSGDPINNLDIVFIGHNFQNLDDFANNVEEKAWGFLFVDPTIKSYKNRINIWRIDELNDLGCSTEKAGNETWKLDCEQEKVKGMLNKCPNDFTYVIFKNSPKNSHSSVRWEFTHPVLKKFNFLVDNFNPFSYVIVPILDDNKKNIFIAYSVVSDYDNYNNVLHEFGHLIAMLPDYYLLDPTCDEHQCRMCKFYLPFSSEPLCIDQQKLVEQLNQFCDAKIIDIKNTAPYPNPWDGSGVVKIDYKVKYSSNSDPCYILMHIYSSNGQEVRVLVTDEPMKATCKESNQEASSIPSSFSLGGEYCEDYYTFTWDGKDNEGREVASGTYFYKISGNPSSSITKKGVIVK